MTPGPARPKTPPPAPAPGPAPAGLRIAIVGSESLRGREIGSALAAAGPSLPVRTLEFYDSDVREEYSRLSEFRGEPKVVHPLDPALLEGLDVVFLAADHETGRRLGDLARQGRFAAIDLEGTFAGDASVPLVVAGVNDGILGTERPRLVANPHPAAIVLSHVLSALETGFRPARAVALVLQPASAFAEDGIQELADQSAAILSGAKLPRKVFREQAAFNVLPRTAKPRPDGFSADEARIAGEVRRVLGRDGFPLSLSILQVPVFHTYAVMTWLELERPATVAGLEAAFRGRDAFRVARGEPATASSVAGKDRIVVGELKAEAPPGRGAWVWAVADNLTAGSAVNALEIARGFLAAPPAVS